MRARLLCLAAAALLLAVSVSGCGGASASSTVQIPGNQLTIYSSLPLQGPSAAVSRQIVGGEKLALSEAGGHVGSFRISYSSLDDSNPKTGVWDPGVTATDAKTAAQDSSTIAYLGDYNSAASAVSLPLINAAGILQVSPASPYVGLTSSQDAGQDEPDRFYPTGVRNFGRLLPSDPVQAAALVRALEGLHVKRVFVLDDENPFQLPLADLFAGDAKRAGIAVAGELGVDTTEATEFKGQVERVAQSGAEAVFFSGGTEKGVVKLWRELYAADPRLWLIGSSSMVSEAFTARIGTAAENTLLGTAELPTAMYPAAAQQVLRHYRALFHELGTANALDGYETMSVVLHAIEAAGANGNDRATVIQRFFATRERDSVLGRYSIDKNGDSTLSRFGIDRVVGGLPVFFRAIETG